MIEETIPSGSTITYQGIDYTTEAELNVIKIVPEAPVDAVVNDTVPPTEPAPVVATAPQYTILKDWEGHVTGETAELADCPENVIADLISDGIIEVVSQPVA